MSANECKANRIRQFQRSYSFIFHPFCSHSLSTCLPFCLLTFFLFLFPFLTMLQFCIWFSLIYFHSMTAFGCQPTFTFCEQDKCCLLRVMLLFSVLEKVKLRVYSASIFSSSFGQRCFFLRFPSESDFKQAQPLALNWTLNVMIESGFPVQTCTNLIC